MSTARRALPTLVAAVLVGLAILAWFGHAFLNYDTFYALLWGGDLAHGRTPQYDAAVTPTPHPLAILAGMPASLFGDGGSAVMVALCLLSMGFLVVGIFWLGTELFAWPVGLLAAVIFVTRVPPLDFGIRGYVDLPAVSLIVWAAVLEARRRRRGWPVLVLLGLAGLLRPEAWLYAGAYWLWLLPARDWASRVRLLALAAAAPVIWALSDLAIAGDALWSFHGTHDLAARFSRERGLGHVPSVLRKRLGIIVRLPELAASAVGLVAGFALMPRRVALPAAIGALNGIAFLVLGAANLSLLGRYLFLATAMLSIFAAVGVLGWTALPRDRRLLSAWPALGSVGLVVLVVFFVSQQVDRLDRLRDQISAQERVQADLHDLVRSRPAQHALRNCGRLYVTNHWPLPELAYWTGRRPKQIVSAHDQRPGRGAIFIAPATARAARYAILDPRDPSSPRTRPPGYRPLIRNRSWVLYADCSAA
jgi:hypothetical protein